MRIILKLCCHSYIHIHIYLHFRKVSFTPRITTESPRWRMQVGHFALSSVNTATDIEKCWYDLLRCSIVYPVLAAVTSFRYKIQR